MLRNVVASTSYATTAWSSLWVSASTSRAPLRLFSSSSSAGAEANATPNPTPPSSSQSQEASSAAGPSSAATLPGSAATGTPLPGSSPPTASSSLYQPSQRFGPSSSSSFAGRRPTTIHKLHVQTTRNNTIITLTRPNGATLYSVSSGQVGFKGANRSGFEAGYQTALNVFETLARRRNEWGAKFRNEPVAWLHVVWNGFGQGRDAVYRAFLSSEGESARAMVHTMSDATKIKIGGVRPKKKRNY
ncbi:translational machinery component [Jaminaea rosea]|uniref:Translational machinery component n=1 Tax=Jaminaea rosea TaxID=1569628 RepID=A0A316ULE7_9BASI|nr:translational machinery component [Jaminaea rosea]PWN26087.1 translational machinery component [Jaminaea rosea]